jgi:hypothetical protein
LSKGYVEPDITVDSNMATALPLEELTKAVTNAAHRIKDRPQLACAEAFRLAAQYGADPHQIGRICNENGIKIVGCQLGCFE